MNSQLRPLSAIEEDDPHLFDNFFKVALQGTPSPTEETEEDTLAEHPYSVPNSSAAKQERLKLDTSGLDDPLSANNNDSVGSQDNSHFSPVANTLPHHQGVLDSNFAHRPRFNSDHSDFNSDVILAYPEGVGEGNQRYASPYESRGFVGGSHYGTMVLHPTVGGGGGHYAEIGMYESLPRSTRSRTHYRRADRSSRVPLTKYRHRSRDQSRDKSRDSSRGDYSHCGTGEGDYLKYSHPYSVIETPGAPRRNNNRRYRGSKDKNKSSGRGNSRSSHRWGDQKGATSVGTLRSSSRRVGDSRPHSNYYSIGGDRRDGSRSRKTSEATYRSVSHYRAIGGDRSADSSHSGHILGGREHRDRRHSKSRGDHYGVGSREREIVVLEEDYSLMLLWVRRVMAGVSFCLYLLVILLFILFATATPQMGMFHSSLSDALSSQETPLQPPSTYYLLIALVYIWNLVWILWSQSVLFSQSSDATEGAVDGEDGEGGCLFRLSPPVLSLSFYSHLILLLCGLCLWPFLADINYPYACLWLVILVLLCAVSASVSLCYNFSGKRDQLLSDFTREFWILKIFAQNGVLSIPCLLLFELCNVITHLVNLEGGSENTAINILMPLTCVILIVYSAADFLIFEHVLRFVVSPYLVSIWFAINLLAKNIDSSNSQDSEGESQQEEDSGGDSSSQLFVFCIALCMISLVLVLLRLFHACYQSLASSEQFSDANHPHPDDIEMALQGIERGDLSPRSPPRMEPPSDEHQITPRDTRYVNDSVDDEKDDDGSKDID